MTKVPTVNNFYPGTLHYYVVLIFENNQNVFKYNIGVKGTKVSFIVSGALKTPPTVEVPFLPITTSRSGQALLNLCVHSADDLIVHEICALQMFQARMARQR